MKQLNSNQKFFWSIFSLSLILITFIFFLHPIHQDLTYHNFAEQRYFGLIPHWGDVITNLGFGIVGLILLLKYRNNQENYGGQKLLFYCFCLSCFALCLGSGYYHWNPNNHGLFLDRATMLLGFSLIFLDTSIRYGIFNHRNLCTKIMFIEFLSVKTENPGSSGRG